MVYKIYTIIPYSVFIFWCYRGKSFYIIYLSINRYVVSFNNVGSRKPISHYLMGEIDLLFLLSINNALLISTNLDILSPLKEWGSRVDSFGVLLPPPPIRQCPAEVYSAPQTNHVDAPPRVQGTSILGPSATACHFYSHKHKARSMDRTRQSYARRIHTSRVYPSPNVAPKSLG